jgi:hypothetical protein
LSGEVARVICARTKRESLRNIERGIERGINKEVEENVVGCDYFVTN